MIRDHLSDRGFRQEEDFRWRGKDVTRIEELTDAVFAFSITLLVVSLEVPSSFDQLMITMQGFFAFSVTFAGIIGIWYAHYIFFRRYGLQDGRTIFLNAVLLLVVIFYIYPLKFLANLLIGYGLMHRVFGLDMAIDASIQATQWPTLMLIYSLGFLAIFLIFVLLYLNAYHKRRELELNEIETFATKTGVQSYLIIVVIAATSIILALTLPINYISLSGWIYCLVGPIMAWFGIRSGKRMERMKAELAEDA